MKPPANTTVTGFPLASLHGHNVMKEPSFTFGIEEEYHLVDLDSRNLAPAPQTLMDQCELELGDQVSPEFFRSQIEIGTRVCSSFEQAREELSRLRGCIVSTAKKQNLAPIAASTHPFARSLAQQTTPKERYEALAVDFAHIGRQMSICGMHVHVGIEDKDLRIDLMNQLRYFLPHLLMLSTSSPFWEGEDTGLKSYRLAIFHELPRTGLPQRFASWGEFERTIDVLVRNNVIEDATKIWWDLRPSVRFPTLEMRVTDVTPRVEDALSIAALFLSTCRMLYRLRRRNQTWRQYPAFLIEENRWRAQRYSIHTTMFDYGAGQLVPFSELIEELLDMLSEDAEALGCSKEIAHARRILAEGTSADRQLAAYRSRLECGGTRQEALEAVVDQLVAETAANI